MHKSIIDKKEFYYFVKQSYSFKKVTSPIEFYDL